MTKEEKYVEDILTDCEELLEKIKELKYSAYQPCKCVEDQGTVMSKEHFKNILRSTAHKKGMKPKDIAKRCSLTERGIHYVLTGERAGRWETLFEIAKALRIKYEVKVWEEQ